MLFAHFKLKFILLITAFSVVLVLPATAAVPSQSPQAQTPQVIEEAQTAEEMVLEVTAKKKKLGTAPTSKTEVTHEQIKKLPMGEENSISKLIGETTPGVTLGPFGQLFFRGNHGNVQYMLDGIPIPDSPTGSYGQIFSPRNFDKLEIITGGFAAEYGMRLGAVVNMTSKSGSPTPEGEVELNYGSYDTFSPHLIYGGSNKEGNLRYFIGLNYMRTGRGINTPQPLSLTNQAQGGTDAIHDSASSDNEFAKIDWQVNNVDKISVAAFNAYNKFQIPNYPYWFTSQDSIFQPGNTDAFGNVGENGAPPMIFIPSTTNDTTGERNSHIQTTWTHTFSEKSFLQVAPFYKYSYINVGNDPTNDLASLYYNPDNSSLNSPHATASGTDPIAKSDPISFAENRHVNHVGLKIDQTYRLNEQHRLKAGTFLQYSRSDGWVSIQSNLQTPPLSNSDPASGLFEGIYIQDEYTIIKPLILNAGLRYDATQFNFSGLNPTDSLLQPRIGLTYLATDTTKIHVFYGKLFQPVSLENIRFATSHSHSQNNAAVEADEHEHAHNEHSHGHARHSHGHSHKHGHGHNKHEHDQHGHGHNEVEKDVAAEEGNITGNPLDLKAEKDDYYEAGISQLLFNGTHEASVNVYYKTATNVVDEHQLFRAPVYQAHNFAQGRAHGVELSLKGDITRNWSHYENYSYNLAEGQELLGGLFPEDVQTVSGWQILDHIQIHTANAGIAYHRGPFWWGTQGLFGSGLRTGPDNNIGLPSHLTFDTTVGYQFSGRGWLSWMGNSRVSGDVINIFNNTYPITIANGYNYSQYSAGRLFYLRLAKSF